MDDGVSPYGSILICVILLVCQFIVSGFSKGIQYYSEHDVEQLPKKTGWLVSWISFYREHSEVCSRTASWATVFLNSVYGILQYHIWSTYLEMLPEWKYYLALCALLCVAMSIYVLVGIYVPHLVCVQKASVFIKRFVGVFYFFALLTEPFVRLTLLLAKGVSRLFGVDPAPDAGDVTEEEIISMVNESHEQGVLLASEAAMIQNIFEFGEKDVKDVMVHRKHITGIDGELTLREAVGFIADHHFSRYPVYLKDLDNILGIFLIKDALGYAQSGEYADWKIKDIPEFIHPVEFVPETHSINTLFTKMQSQKNHMVIVVDEYGQTSGITSMEDILEEIVGNIWDEHDEESESIEKVTDDDFLMEGISELDQVGEILGVDFPDELETLNGFIISLIDKIPADHESFSVKALGYEFHVSDVENKMIQSVRVTKLPPKEDAHLETPSEK